jgi:hypothetical protein
MSPFGLRTKKTALAISMPWLRMARAPMMVSPELVFCRIQGAASAEAAFDLPERSWVSILSDQENACAAIGLMTPTDSTPNSSAPMQHGSRNCHADTPAERAMTSSYLRLSETSVAIAENSPTNGTVCSMIIGILSPEMANAVP